MGAFNPGEATMSSPIFSRGRSDAQRRWPHEHEWPVRVLKLHANGPNGFDALVQTRCDQGDGRDEGNEGDECGVTTVMCVLARDELDVFRKINFYNNYYTERRAKRAEKEQR